MATVIEPIPITIDTGAKTLPAKGRITWLDIARGLTIIFVVIGHVERGLVGAHIARGHIWQWMDYAIYTFHMPAFFLFAGLTAYMSLNRKTTESFLKEKLWTIVYPYFLWSIFQGLVMYALASLTNSKESIHQVLSIGWSPTGQFWFLYALMIYQVLGAIGFRHRIPLLILSACMFLAASFVTMPSIVHDTCHFMIFYTIGFFDLTGIVAFIRQRRSALIPVFSVLFILVTYISGILDGTNFYSILALPSTVFGVGLVLAISLGASGKMTRVLTGLGAASMTIYVFHILFAAGTRIALKKLHIPQDPWLYLVVSTFIGVIGPYILHRVLDRNHLLAPLGLAPFRRRTVLQAKPA